MVLKRRTKSSRKYLVTMKVEMEETYLSMVGIGRRLKMQSWRTTFGIMGKGNWKDAEKSSGLSMNSSSCQLWCVASPRPNLKKGPFSEEEEHHFDKLQAMHGNNWSKIAAALPRRTRYAVKKFWNGRGRKRH
ncbi:hypothetical protein MLD38_009519 [Melastoma candidum]|uniref:Uncharacterized protein n=1 Tax=Melastoma candidum TaxID=119954 RepID=A0ACB9RXG8_9MYRT|nr:hypothetical protein MLD38_009519 [Melastoma candidum]